MMDEEFMDEEAKDESTTRNAEEVLGKQRTKNWVLAQERAMEVLEEVLRITDIKSLEVYVKSRREKYLIEEFIADARKRLNPYGEEFYPSTVADDSISIFEGLQYFLEGLRDKFENSFRSILVVNEDMNEFINTIESDTGQYKDAYFQMKEENAHLKTQLEKVKEENEQLKQGVEPIRDLIKLRMQGIIDMFEDFKSVIGEDDTQELRRHIPIFEKEIDTTIKMIKIKQRYIFKEELEQEEREADDNALSFEDLEDAPSESEEAIGPPAKSGKVKTEEIEEAMQTADMTGGVKQEETKPKKPKDNSPKIDTETVPSFVKKLGYDDDKLKKAQDKIREEGKFKTKKEFWSQVIYTLTVGK